MLRISGNVFILRGLDYQNEIHKTKKVLHAFITKDIYLTSWLTFLPKTTLHFIYPISWPQRNIKTSPIYRCRFGIFFLISSRFTKRHESFKMKLCKRKFRGGLGGKVENYKVK